MMGEAELLPSGALMAGEREIGRVEGFRLSGAENAGALPAEQALLLAREYDSRAEHFAAAPNNDIAAAQDGFIRWRGQLVAKLTAGENILRPDFVLLADDAVSPAAREKIAQRLRRFISLHFETALKPLADLAAAEALFEKPRALALKLVEHLGIVPRRDIAAEVKELDQDSRAALRRLGVRFGVYHIFIPALLKPAPAEALTFLWALKNDAQTRPGYGDIVSYLMAGRTSFAVEENFARPFYRLAGYRILGKRAVRIDMLERCADLIRLATAWQPGKSAAPRPGGAYDGKYFTISQAMLSILGTTPEDMEDILKQLGYVAQPIAAADYQAFLRKAALAGSNAAGVPAAEPVGHWPAAEAVAAEQQPAAAADNANAANLPAAEPVGPKFAAGKAVAQDNNVLLWRYQKRVYKRPHKQAGKRAEQRGKDAFARHKRAAGAEQAGQRQSNGGASLAAADKTRRASEQKAGGAQRGREWTEKRQQNGHNGRPQRDFGKARNFDGRQQRKPINIEDSPFAALAALRDKLRK